MPEVRPRKRELSNAYELFILVLTILSLAGWIAAASPVSAATRTMLEVYDTLICIVLLFDFGLRLRRARSRWHYFIREWGWLDLIGSIPTFAAFRFAGVLRLARLGRVVRVLNLMRGKKRREMWEDVLAHRGRYATFLTLLTAAVLLVVASTVVLGFETASGRGNITTGGEALWWSIVTLTTVGYGDYWPVTAGGQITAVVLMLLGVGIIGALASILASVLVASPNPTGDTATVPEPTPSQPTSSTSTQPSSCAPSSAIEEELRAIRTELESLRKLVERGPTGPDPLLRTNAP